ncbi:MAG TPA: hypothetical protein PLN48_17860 [Lachnospiraceae bacterium]|nr:hypothetical protein [Lachnospiraceae bacterium]
MEEKKRKNSKIWWFIAGAAVMAAGFLMIPPLLRKFTNKIAKHSCSAADIDFDDLGPEIVHNDEAKEKE